MYLLKISLTVKSCGQKTAKEEEEGKEEMGWEKQKGEVCVTPGLDLANEVSSSSILLSTLMHFY